MSDTRNRSPNIREQHKYIDLSATPEPVYICETCGVRLAYFPQAQTINPHAGKSYICPRCQEITDSSLFGLQHADEIRPIDIAMPVFTVVPESKGNEILFKPYDDHDPEPQEEEILKAQGATIISKRVEAKNDFS